MTEYTDPDTLVFQQANKSAAETPVAEKVDLTGLKEKKEPAPAQAEQDKEEHV